MVMEQRVSEASVEGWRSLRGLGLQCFEVLPGEPFKSWSTAEEREAWQQNVRALGILMKPRVEVWEERDGKTWLQIPERRRPLYPGSKVRWCRLGTLEKRCAEVWEWAIDPDTAREMGTWMRWAVKAVLVFLLCGLISWAGIAACQHPDCQMTLSGLQGGVHAARSCV